MSHLVTTVTVTTTVPIVPVVTTVSVDPTITVVTTVTAVTTITLVTSVILMSLLSLVGVDMISGTGDDERGFNIANRIYRERKKIVSPGTLLPKYKNDGSEGAAIPSGNNAAGWLL